MLLNFLFWIRLSGKACNNIFRLLDPQLVINTVYSEYFCQLTKSILIRNLHKNSHTPYKKLAYSYCMYSSGLIYSK